MARIVLVLLAQLLLAAGQQSANANRPIVNMFSKPTIDSDVVSQATYGVAVEILEEKPGSLCS